MRIAACIVFLLGLTLLLSACAPMPPERAAHRAMLEAAATECRHSFPVVLRVEVDRFDRLVAWYYDNVSQREIEPFWQCVRDRIQQKQLGISPEPRIVGGHYVNEAKSFKVAVPPPEWRPSLLRDKPDQVADVAFERSGGYMVAAAVRAPDSFQFSNVNEWWIKTISSKWGWTDIKILEQRDLKVAGFPAQFVAFEFTGGGMRQVDMTYHISVPRARYNLYRIRMTCVKQRCDEFGPVYQGFVDSFSFLP